MRKISSFLLVSIVLLVAEQGYAAEIKSPFSMTFEQFRTALDTKINADATTKNSATTSVCKAKVMVWTCSFRDAAFKSSVAEFKKLGLAKGNFIQKLQLTVETEGGKVNKIRVNGERGDPMNLFAYVGTVLNVMQVFDPENAMDQAGTGALTKELGLMRGDDALRNEGDFLITTSKPYASIGCMAVPSSITTGVACRFEPSGSITN